MIRLPVFLYHRVGPPCPGTYPDLTISPDELEHHLRWLARRGYVGIRPRDWLAWREVGKALPDKPILLTFDDAYEDTAQHGFPILKRYGFNAAVYVVTREVGGTNSWDQQAWGSAPLRLMSLVQIREWAAQGIEFGAHTRTHRDLTTLGEKQMAEEVAGSALDLAEILGAPAISFAYPYGPYNQAARNCAVENFKLALSSDEGLNTLATDPFLMRRTEIWPRMSLIDLEAKLRWGYNPAIRLHLRARLRIRTRAKALRRWIVQRSD